MSIFPRAGTLIVTLRLGALPAFEPGSATPAGTFPLGLGGTRDAVLYVPASYDPSAPAALAVLLHGAGSDAASMLATQTAVADTIGILLLSIDSRAYTWDAILSFFDRDPPFITSALADVVRRYDVDRRRIGLVGHPVQFVEFEGGHVMRRANISESLRWIAARWLAPIQTFGQLQWVDMLIRTQEAPCVPSSLVSPCSSSRSPSWRPPSRPSGPEAIATSSLASSSMREAPRS